MIGIGALLVLAAGVVAGALLAWIHFEFQLADARAELLAWALEKSAEDVAGEAYQVIGALAASTGCFDAPEVQQALDYFSGDLTGEILPFTAPATKST